MKADVFDMVKNLNLPVLQGDTALLKKLQALGLHSNRWVEVHSTNYINIIRFSNP